jgi:hypothetical protein
MEWFRRQYGIISGGVVTNPSKKRTQTFPTEILRKGSEKSPKRKKWQKHKQALRNHAESSIHTMKGSYKAYLPPDHPSLS